MDKQTQQQTCDYCAQSGIESVSTHDVAIEAGSMHYGTSADATEAHLCDECYAEMMRS